MSDARKADRRRTTVYFPHDVARDLAVFCAGNDVEMSQIVSEAVKAKLNERVSAAAQAGVRPRNALVQLNDSGTKEDNMRSAKKKPTGQTTLLTVVDGQAATPPTKLRFEFVLVTKELAMAWLERNYHVQRSISRAAVERMAADMKAGKWHLTHQGIAFNESGQLVDGQHRLTAVVEADAKVWMTVSHYGNPNVPLGSFDTGTRRSCGNALEIEGAVPKGHGKRVASIATVLYQALANRTSAPTKEQIAAIYRVHKESIDWSLHAVPKGPRLVASVAAAFAYAYPIAPGKVESFARKIVTQTNIDPDSAENHVNRMLMKPELAKEEGQRNKQNHLSASDTFCKVLSGIEASLLGTTVTRLQAPSRASDSMPQVIQRLMQRRRAMGYPAGAFGED